MHKHYRFARTRNELSEFYEKVFIKSDDQIKNREALSEKMSKFKSGKLSPTIPSSLN